MFHFSEQSTPILVDLNLAHCPGSGKETPEEQIIFVQLLRHAVYVILKTFLLI